ncbi:MAG TPA: CrcB family protein [Symbiobacteriaceae bacterium]|nr:CrcB family protein [Symbiobacteriaceae bacterium]
MLLLSIAAAGFAGAVARFWVGTVIARRRPGVFPWATFLINITGAFALGFVAGSGRIPSAVRVPLGAGFLGAYTTFSTWMLESARLHRRLALVNISLSTACGLLAAAAGLFLARKLT